MKSIPRHLLTCLVLLMAGAPTLAEAACSAWHNNTPPLDQTIPPPPSTVITLAPVAIGQVMASVRLRLDGGMGNFSCGTGTLYGMTVTNMSLQESGQPQVYQTSIEGVGVRVGFREAYMGGWPETRYPPFEASDFAHDIMLSIPYYAQIEFVRTDMRVGKGSVVFSYGADFNVPTTPETVIPFTGTNLRFNLTHNSYYTSCLPVLPTVEVPMGQVGTHDMKNDQAPSRPFDFDVHCEGMNPTTPPPVRVYFQGNATEDGWLRLDHAGEAGVASGVGIALESDLGMKLPFARERALPMKWRSGNPQGQIYRFSGLARYSRDGSVVAPGTANASLTYVLEYN